MSTTATQLNTTEPGPSGPGFVVPGGIQVRTLDDADAHVRSLWINDDQLAGRVRQIEKLLDVWDSPWWKIVIFVIDGWPMRRVVKRPQWRPWRRWWTS